MNIPSKLYPVISLIFILVFSSCKSQETTDEVPIVKYLALGDSYTIGQGVQESLRWPNQLTQKLLAHNIEVAKTDIIAETGWRTRDLLDAMATAEIEDYNLVSLLIGVNNQFSNQSFEIFTVELDILLNKAIRIAGGKERVFVLSIPDYGVTPFGNNNKEQIAAAIDKYNAFIQQKCKENGVLFIDITSISRQLGDSDGALASDNLHPSGKQYLQWIEKTFPLIKTLLAE